ncbi:MAG: hypothetical protein IKG37_00325, partial [Solobacterium sp.]|nr:hypothetical protein [Solobacterium sp.]
NADAKGIDFKYYPDFSVVVMSKESDEKTSSKIPVQYLVQKMEFYKRELAREDDREILREKTIQYYTTGKGKESWTYLQHPEEMYEDPEYGRAMEDLYFTDNVGEDDIESLVYMRRHVDPMVTAKQMKLCRQEILSLLGEAEPPKKLCAELMDFIDAHEDLKKYWEEHINVDCRKKAE